MHAFMPWHAARSVVLFLMVACGTTACDLIKGAATSAENNLFAEPPYTPVEGVDAAASLQPVAGAVPFDPATLYQAMDVAAADASKAALALNGTPLADDSDDIPEVSGATIDFLTAGAEQKANLKPDSFKLNDFAAVGPKKANGSPLLQTPDDDGYDPRHDSVDLSDAAWSSKSEILISTAARVSVKNQGQRGTCAAHAGIGQLEYLIMKKHGSELAAIDLSEQRFYMLSLSALWTTGGGVVDQDGGSWWPNGFAMSYGVDGKKPPASTNPYNIPLESDCPYNAEPGANEIQIPQSASCLTGAVRVSNMTATHYLAKNGGGIETQTTGPRTAQQIFDFIKKNDVPVAIGTVLSENWMTNDGMVTLAQSAKPGEGPHAGGHAYLIVGMRKISEATFPKEGGMCFIVKNSWGTGWGVNGYSCITLAWFNEFRFTMPFDAALDAEVDLDRAKQAAAASGASLPPPADGAVEINTSGSGDAEPAPAVVTTADPGTPTGGDAASGSGGATVPTTTPTTTEDGFTLGRLQVKSGELMQALYKSDGSTLTLRGIYAGATGVTKDLLLKLDGASILLDDELRSRKNVHVGDVSGDLLTLCSGKYAQTCLVNLVKEENRLVVGLTEAEFRTYEPDPKADYKTLASFANYGIEAAIGANALADFRFIIKGLPTNPIRLAIKPVSGTINYQGREIGNYQKLQFCTGDYASVCRVVMNKDDRSIKIVFKAKAG